MPLMKLEVSRTGSPSRSICGGEPGQLGEEHPQLQPGEVRPQAQVRALAEGEVAGGAQRVGGGLGGNTDVPSIMSRLATEANPAGGCGPAREVNRPPAAAG
jgi:hypothetical protein